MQYDEFISKVVERSDLDRDAAEALTAATLRTLAERITGGEAEDLAAQLPEELKLPLTAGVKEAAEPFDVAEFIRRVAERARTDGDTALASQGAIFSTLREAVTPGELDDIISQLPQEFRGLVGPPGGAGPG